MRSYLHKPTDICTVQLNKLFVRIHGKDPKNLQVHKRFDDISFKQNNRSKQLEQQIHANTTISYLVSVSRHSEFATGSKTKTSRFDSWQWKKGVSPRKRPGQFLGAQPSTYKTVTITSDYSLAIMTPDHEENLTRLSFQKVSNLCGCTDTAPCFFMMRCCNHRGESVIFFLLAIRLFELFWLRLHLYVV